eukprot:2798622-Prorocentrum_lima.AAC.1
MSLTTTALMRRWYRQYHAIAYPELPSSQWSTRRGRWSAGAEEAAGKKWARPNPKVCTRRKSKVLK